MPIPLLPIAAAVVAASVAAAFAGVRPKPKNSKKVAILGAERTGKTRLLAGLEAASSEGGLDNATGAEGAVHFSLKVGGRHLDFEVSQDVSGSTKAKFTDWKEEFLGADYVLYLFRADLIYAEDPKQIQLVKLDLDMMMEWADKLKAKAPRVVLIGTWADQHPHYGEGRERFRRKVRASDPIKLGRGKFSKKASVVIGSLDDGTTELVADLASAML